MGTASKMAGERAEGKGGEKGVRGLGQASFSLSGQSRRIVQSGKRLLTSRNRGEVRHLSGRQGRGGIEQARGELGGEQAKAAESK